MCQILTQKRLKEVLKYDPETGIFNWLISKHKRGGKTKIGDSAGYIEKNGYVSIGIDNKVFYAHRLAFLYMTGELPKDQIDHKDTIRHHNCWDNLRDATNKDNGQNRNKPLKTNICGLLGVSPKRNKFQARIHVNGKTINLGIFNTPKEAHQAYIDAKKINHKFYHF